MQDTSDVLFYKDLESTDFFPWFHIHETERVVQAGGFTLVKLEPGAFTEFIALQVRLDTQERIVDSSLTLNQAWLLNAKGYDPMAIDLAKSFILNLVAPADRELAAEFDRALWNLMLQKPAMTVMMREAPPEPAPSTDLTPLLDVYAGRRESAHHAALHSLLAFENIERNGAPWLHIRIDLTKFSPGDPGEPPTSEVQATRGPIGDDDTLPPLPQFSRPASSGATSQEALQCNYPKPADGTSPGLLGLSKARPGSDHCFARQFRYAKARLT